MFRAFQPWIGPVALFFSAAQIGVRFVLSLWESLGLGLGLNQDLFSFFFKPQSVPQKKMTRPGRGSICFALQPNLFI